MLLVSLVWCLGYGLGLVMVDLRLPGCVVGGWCFDLILILVGLRCLRVGLVAVFVFLYCTVGTCSYVS